MDLAPDFANTPVSPRRPHFHYVADGEPAPPAVTIVTPYFNTGEIFLETAQSVLQQSLQQWEWLIVNDGSDEPEAVGILDDFRSQDSRTRVIDLDRNQGLPAARNAGIQQARAEYVFFLDSDDLIEPTALEKMTWLLESYPEFSFCKGFSAWFGAQECLSTLGFEAADRFLQWNTVNIISMVRRKTALAVGGFDESFTSGLEDWDFWLHCASQGHWGRTIPEFLDWYRQRQTHTDRWLAWTESGEQKMRKEFRRRYPDLYANGLPRVTAEPLGPYDDVRDDMPFANLLTKKTKRVLLVIPWMAMGGADKFNLDLIKQLKGRGYEISIATTLAVNYAWYQEFANLTPDIFILPNFLRLNDYPRFLYYLIQSRQFDFVLVSNSGFGYKLLPYLRSRLPDTVFVDFCHMEEEYWNNGGHPRHAVAYQDLLDLNIVSSQHLKEWMIQRGADQSQIEVCYTNIDTELLFPDSELRLRVRSELGIASEIPVILYAGRICEQKQPQVFAKVMAELQARNLEYICLVAGDGEDRKWLARFLRRNNLTSQVRMLGAVSNARVRELMAASDIFFLPSKMEGIALTIFETMAMGIVPVGADVGGQKELVTAECGILIQRSEEEQEVEVYSDALQKLLESPELRASMGQAARDRVCSHFQIEQMGQRMEALLVKSEQLHRMRPKPAIGPGLGTEHAVLAIEGQRTLRAAGGLWKYQRVESATRRMSGLILPKMARLKGLAWRLRNFIQPLRKVKDAIWIVGHQAKVRLFDLEE